MNVVDTKLKLLFEHSITDQLSVLEHVRMLTAGDGLKSMRNYRSLTVKIPTLKKKMSPHSDQVN